MTKERVYNGYLKIDVFTTPQGKKEVISIADAVAIFVYDPKKDEVLLVRQPRAPMITGNNPTGELTEVAAGRFDQPTKPADLIVSELQEELGITITATDIQFLNQGQPLATTPGIATEKIYLAYVELKPGMLDQTERIYGRADENEFITRHFIKRSLLKDMVFDDLKTYTLVQWFLAHH